VHPGRLSACIDEKKLKVGFPALDDKAFVKYVKDRGLQSLTKSCISLMPGQGIPIRERAGPARLHRRQHEIGEPPNPAKFLWPFTLGLSILLFDKKEATVTMWRARAAATTRPIASIFSAQTPLDPTDLGFPDWKTLADASPASGREDRAALCRAHAWT